MSIHFTKNVHFTKLVRVEGRLREFNFRKMGGPAEEKFSVDTVDLRGNRIMFFMKKENENWKINSGLVPVWVTQSEANLNEMIKEELNLQ